MVAGSAASRLQGSVRCSDAEGCKFDTAIMQRATPTWLTTLVYDDGRIYFSFVKVELSRDTAGWFESAGGQGRRAGAFERSVGGLVQGRRDRVVFRLHRGGALGEPLAATRVLQPVDTRADQA